MSSLCQVEFLERVLLSTNGVDKQIFRLIVDAAYSDGDVLFLSAFGDVYPQSAGKRINPSRRKTIQGD